MSVSDARLSPGWQETRQPGFLPSCGRLCDHAGAHRARRNGDFRAPNAIRFGFTPLYISERDVEAAVDILADIMTHNLWDAPEFKQKALVT